MFTLGQFKFLLADTEDLKNEIFRLRYRVYVEEFGFEKPSDHPGGLEMDEYDPYSIHFAALNENDKVVGTIRMIMDSSKGFPMEKAAKFAFIGEKPSPSKISEISRLAVERNYRRRLEDGFYGVESYLLKKEGGILESEQDLENPKAKRKQPVIVLGLYRLVYQHTKRIGLSHWYMIVEKALCYALKRFGWLFHQVGEPVEYHGLRIPYLGILADIEPYLMRKKPDLFPFYAAGLEKRFLPGNVDQFFQIE
ncbi:MAG TPA: PEP-CTERM/exosortase system-associated acyltransferase [Desulfonatronum sp.]|nr:PEP-CTERM/exosortase system-associated acyltransferase [Desulfonatronum sp.]